MAATNANKTVEERLERLEQEHDQFMHLVVTAGGILKNLPPNATLEEIRQLIREVGGRILSVRKIPRGR